MIYQTDQDFTLYIITGPAYCEATRVIESLDYGNLNKQFIHTETDLSEWRSSINESGNWGHEHDEGCPEVIARNANYPLTTIMARIDIDDWVTPGWIASMKYLATNIDKESFLINYQVIGHGLDGRNYKFFAPHLSHRTSPFLSLVQKGNNKINPYADVHLKMGKLFNTVVTIPPAYCFMVVHGENRSNRIYDEDKYLEDIAIEKLGKFQLISNDPLKVSNYLLQGVRNSSWKQRIASASA
jgi:hypothetical protein